MPVESPKFDVSLRDLRHIRGVTGDLESTVASPRGGERYAKTSRPIP
jgi:hypothetical protein